MKLRWYQQEAVTATWPHLFPYTGSNPVIVLPTGAGKSLVIAELARVAVQEWGGQVLVVQHRKELIVQNAEKLYALLPDVEIGIYSAGLKSKQTDQKVLCCGIQSVYERAHQLGRRHLVIIDECHLLGDDAGSMYRTFLAELSHFNPKLRVVGLTATPFRAGTGPICSPTAIFRKVAYSAPVQRLMSEEFLCPVTNQATETHYATEKLNVRGGEFVAREVENLFGDDGEKIKAACAEIVAKAAGRHSTIVFCAGVRHAEAVAGCLASLTGERTETVTGSTDDLTRLAALNDFKAGKLRILVNVDVFTTGMDAPCIDCLVILRATQSPGLFAQIVGRGFRPHESKTNCLILDFGGNFERHGPIDSEDYGRKKGGHGDKTGEAPTKVCPGCEQEVRAALAVCECGFAFPNRELKHGTEADTQSAVLEKQPEPETWTVKSWAAGRHRKKKQSADEPKPDTLRIDYQVVPVGGDGIAAETISEWVCLEHEGFALRNAKQWWTNHSLAPLPTSIDEALALLNQGACARPAEITTLAEGRFKTIIRRDIGKLPETWGIGDSWEADEWAAMVPGDKSEWTAAKDDLIPF